MALCSNQLALLYPGCYLSFSYQANQPGMYLGSTQAILLDTAPSHRGKVVYLCYLMFIQPYLDSDHVYQPGEGLPGVFSLDPAGQVHLGTDVFDTNQTTPRKANQRIDLLSDLSNEELALPGTFSGHTGTSDPYVRSRCAAEILTR